MDKNYRDLYNRLMIFGINEYTIEKTLIDFTPKGINYDIKREGEFTALFVPADKTIKVSINNINNWLFTNTYDLKNKYNLQTDTHKIMNYLYINLFTHEIEHSKQYLISEKEIEGYKILQEGYKCLFDIMRSNKYERIPVIRLGFMLSRLSKLLLYNANQNEYCLERDANIEAFHQIRELAKYNKDEEIYKYAALVESNYLRLGYETNGEGSLKQTLDKIGLKKKYEDIPKDEDIPFYERIRYGLEVPDEKIKNIILK